MIIAHYHEKVKHQGKGFTINKIRSNGYWIPGISKTVVFYIRWCVLCRKLRSTAEIQKMADLQLEQMNPSPPFMYTSMNSFAPFLVKEGYFRNALCCFIVIRGTLWETRSDQGTNFILYILTNFLCKKLTQKSTWVNWHRKSNCILIRKTVRFCDECATC